MTPEEIIKKSSWASGTDPDANWKTIDAVVKHGGGKLLRHKNSVLFLGGIPNQRAYFSCHFYSTDSPVETKTNGAALFNEVKQIKGIERVYGNTKDQNIIRLMRLVGVDVMPSDLPQYTWMSEI